MPGGHLTRGVDAVVVQVVVSEPWTRRRQLGPRQRLVANLAHATHLAAGGCAGAGGQK